MKFLIFLALLAFSRLTLADGDPNFLGLKGNDGVIRQVPDNCGPNARTENSKKYGLLCIQNEDAKKLPTKPCVDNRGSNVDKNGSLYSCLLNKNGDITVYSIGN